MKHMPKWLVYTGYTAGIILVVISSVLTAILFESMDHGTWVGIMFAIGGLSLDAGKITTAAATAELLKQKKWLSPLLPATLYVLCFVVSMVASQSFDLNKANKIQNQTILSSDAYNMNMGTFKTAESNISYYREKIAKIEASESQRIKDLASPLLQEKASAKKKRWLTTPVGSPRRGVDVIEKDIANVPQQVKHRMRAEIQEIEAQIAQASQNQQASKHNIDSMKNGSGIKTTEGLIAYAEWKNPENPQKALGDFYLFKNVFCEILGTYLLVFMNPKKAKHRIRAEIQPKQPKQSDELSKKRASKQEPSKQEIDLFLKHKRQNPRMGYKKLANKMGIAENRAGTIQVFLKEKGVLKENGNYTIIA